MLLPKFDFHEPETLEEVCGLMNHLKDKARLLAGGTDLLVNMKKKIISPQQLVSISRIDALRGIDASNGLIRIGAGVTVADILESSMIKRSLGALAEGAAVLGSPLIRNMATLGGNISTARPAADLPPPLMAYGTKVLLRSRRGEREIPLGKFFKGPGQTLLEPDEIITAFIIEKPQPHSGVGYVKLGVRAALEISIVNTAAYLRVDQKDGSIGGARIVLGAVAPMPIRAPSAEKILLGEKPHRSIFARAGEAAAQDSKPIDDFRGSAQYRRDMVKVMTRRALSRAWDDLLQMNG